MRSERGNILFLILLAVVLFAALSYAVTNSMRGGSKDGSGENADAAAADLLSWFGQLDQGVQRMMLTGGIPLEQISFKDGTNKMQDGATDWNTNNNCTNASCEVYNGQGGNMVPRKFEQYADWSADTGASDKRRPGHSIYIIQKMNGLRSPLNDIVVRVNYLTLPVCKAVNRKMGLPDCPNATLTGSLAQFAGSAVSSNLDSSSVYTYSGSDIYNVQTFCTCSGTYGNVHHAIIER